MRAAGVPDGPAMGMALSAIPRAVKELGRDEALERLADVAAAPQNHTEDPYFSAVAERLVADYFTGERAA